MQNSERQIALIKNVEIRLWLKTNYDLYLTDRRMVLVHKVYNWGKGRGTGAGAIGTVIEAAAQKAMESKTKRKEEEMSRLTLDELLAKDEKSFDMVYEDIEKIKLRIIMGDRRLDVTSQKKQKEIKLTKEQYEQLSTILPDISALKGKLEN